MPKEIESEILLCTEVENKVFVFNAGLGKGYDMEVEIKLPAGMILVPDKSRIFYPAGSTQSFLIPAPTSLGSNSYKWRLSNFWTFHRLQGLSGTTAEPNNGFELSFFTNTTCDFVSGSSIFYSTMANQICDIPTNHISKVSNPYNILGAPIPYIVEIYSSLFYKSGCIKDSLKINFSFKNPKKSGTYVNADLPQGWSLIP